MCPQIFHFYIKENTFKIQSKIPMIGLFDIKNQRALISPSLVKLKISIVASEL